MCACHMYKYLCAYIFINVCISYDAFLACQWYTIGAMSGRMEDLKRGYLILLPVLDEKGRAIIYVNCALMGEQVEEVRTKHTCQHHMTCSLKMFGSSSPLCFHYLDTSGMVVFDSYCNGE